MEYVSDKCFELTGYHKNQLLRNKVLSYNDLVLPQYRDHLWKVWDDAVRNHKPVYEEYRILTADNQEKWVWEQGIPVYDSKGKLEGLEGLIIDITDRRKAEFSRDSAFLNLEKRMKALENPVGNTENITFLTLFNLDKIQKLQDEFAEAVGVASIITYPDGTPITKPSNFCRLCDIIRGNEKGLINCHVSDAMIGRHHPEGPVIQKCLSAGLWDAGASITVGEKHIANWLIGEVRDENQDAEEIREYARIIGADEDEAAEAYSKTYSMPIEKFKKIAQVLFTLANQISEIAYQNWNQAKFISDLKIAEDQREIALAEKEKLQAMLIQSQKMESVGRLAGGVAHDFNNMLSVILGHSELMLEQIDSSHVFYMNLKEIKQAAERSAALTRQLLAFARKQSIVPKILNLNKTVEGMLSIMQRLIGENIKLSLIPGENLWNVKADISQINQVLTNLCVNSRDAINGSGEITIETSNTILDSAFTAVHPGFSEGEYVKLAVSDNGCGINTKNLQNLFEPFYTTKESGKGTGLGLATVYGIVKQNNGFIDVSSKPGTGSTFTIFLPRAFGKNAVPQENETKKEIKKGIETILLVEDETAILEITAIMLKNMGYNVISSSAPDEALILAEKYAGEINLLITDVIMPGINGRDLSEKILALSPDMKCLFISGYTADVIASQGILNEGIQFIQKPFSMNDLSNKIRVVLES
ncbi:MAG: PocR ligand-binding domain-containing protein [Spirochaetales bacterium]|nr:PocR ligand-binding domain-containing protein [Spirochaetales bacterium]